MTKRYIDKRYGAIPLVMAGLLAGCVMGGVKGEGDDYKGKLVKPISSVKPIPNARPVMAGAASQPLAAPKSAKPALVAPAGGNAPVPKEAAVMAAASAVPKEVPVAVAAPAPKKAPVAAAPVSPPAQPAKPVVEKLAIRSGQRMSEALAAWCKSHGWTLSWSGSEVVAEADVEVQGSYEHVIELVLDALNRNGAQLGAVFYDANHVLRVTEKPL